MTEAARATLLEDELMRPVPQGLRPFSVGIWRLCNKLNIDLSGSSGGERGWSKIAWLLDLRNDRAKICSVEPGPEFEALIAEYEFGIAPAFLASVKLEFEITVTAVKLATVKIEPKPDEPAARVPEKKS